MRSVDISNLIRYQTGLYKGKVDWERNVGKKVNFTYNDLKGEIEIIKYVKLIPQGILTVKYKDNIQEMKTTQFTKGAISILIGRVTRKYTYNTNDIVITKYGSVKIIKQIKIQYTKSKERGYEVECLNCNNIYNMRESTLHTCPICSDWVSYPEKYVMKMFQILNEKFEIQKMYDWAGLKRYDLYIPKLNTLIEVHGIEHYEPSVINAGYKKYYNTIDKEENLRNVIENDKLKKELALHNGFNESQYIVIDARWSTNKHIKQSILNSDLNLLFDLTKIDWIECHKFACCSSVKIASNLWNENKTITEISYTLKLSEHTIMAYLKDGSECGYCVYDNHLNHVNGHINSPKRKQSWIPVVCINTGEVFESQTLATEAYNIYKSGVNDCCTGRIPSAGKHPTTGESLKWMFYDEYLKLSEDEIKNYILKKTNLSIKVICLNTKEIFNSLDSASLKFNFKSTSSISSCCKGNKKSAGKHPITNEPLIWMYYKDYMELHSNEEIAI